jgi:hypothetical protein
MISSFHGKLEKVMSRHSISTKEGNHIVTSIIGGGSGVSALPTGSAMTMLLLLLLLLSRRSIAFSLWLFLGSRPTQSFVVIIVGSTTVSRATTVLGIFQTFGVTVSRAVIVVGIFTTTTAAGSVVLVVVVVKGGRKSQMLAMLKVVNIILLVAITFVAIVVVEILRPRLHLWCSKFCQVSWCSSFACYKNA